MKKIKLGYLAIVLVFAIGFTAATKAHEINAVSSYACRQGTDFILLFADFKRCIDGTVIPNDRRNDDFSVPANSNPETLCPGQGLFAMKNLDAGILADEDFECTSGSNEFCCARVVDNDLFGTCENTTYPVSIEIFCKTADQPN